MPHSFSLVSAGRCPNTATKVVFCASGVQTVGDIEKLCQGVARVLGVERVVHRREEGIVSHRLTVAVPVDKAPKEGWPARIRAVLGKAIDMADKCVPA